MSVLKDFECQKHGIFEDMVPGEAQDASCPKCKKLCQSVMLQFPGSAKDYGTGFHPHYDLQLGQHFQNKEQKDKFLKDTGRIQWNGPASQKRDSKTMFKCSREQAKKEFGIAKPQPLPRVTNEEL